MRISLSRRRVRVCNLCAERWVVTGREAAGAPVAARRPPRAPGRGASSPALADSFAAALETWEAYRRCPRCGVDDFTQSRVTRRQEEGDAAPR